MGKVLDIVPLRSLVAVADCGGFQRAAASLHLSQAGVSQHVRRLEAATGCALVERHGRGSRFTAAGDRLLEQARRILALHDDTLRGFSTPMLRTVTIGSTEHAAAHLLPALATALELNGPGHRFRFRIDRGLKLRQGLAAGAVDVALLLQSDDPAAASVGELELTWFSSPGWTCPAAPTPVPVVAFDEPCALRSRALETLARHALPAVVGAEATQLAGVQAAVGAGLGVALMATMGETPQGLVARHDLPVADPLPLYVCPRPGLDTDVAHLVSEAVAPLLPRRLVASGGA